MLILDQVVIESLLTPSFVNTNSSLFFQLANQFGNYTSNDSVHDCIVNLSANLSISDLHNIYLLDAARQVKT